jgi:hypothetical protein
MLTELVQLTLPEEGEDDPTPTLNVVEEPEQM